MTTPTTTPDTAGVDRVLTGAADARRQQLDALPPAGDDQVVAAQRAALVQTLAEIAAAQRRLADGSYGRCTGCRRRVSAARLELRPWAATCIACAGR